MLSMGLSINKTKSIMHKIFLKRNRKKTEERENKIFNFLFILFSH